jgi:DNA-binding beta-propeller fold protein YncE
VRPLFIAAIAAWVAVAATACVTAVPGQAVLPTITIDGDAFSGMLALDPASQTLYVATRAHDKDDPDTTHHSLSVIDLATHAITATIPLSAGADDIDIDSGTHTIYVVSPVSRADDEALVTVVDGATNTVTAEIPTGKYSLRTGIDNQTHTAYVLSHSRHAVANDIGALHNSTISAIPPGADRIGEAMPAVVAYADDIAIDSRSHTPYVVDDEVSVIDPATNALLREIALPSSGQIALFDPDSATLCVVDEKGEITIVDPVTARVTYHHSGFGSLEDDQGIRIAYAATLDATTHTFYTAADGLYDDNDRITAIDTITGEVTGTWKVPSPHTLAIDPTTHTLYVASCGTVMIHPRPTP